MSEPIRSITIVGGGTAGWLTAAYLNAYLSWRPETPAVEITVIESPNIPTVGVGEATVPRMSRLLNLLGISESEFFRRCNASFKLGVQFNAWNLHDDGSARNYLHPFNTPREEGELNPGYLFHRFVRDPHVFFGDVAAPSRTAVSALKGPRGLISSVRNEGLALLADQQGRSGQRAPAPPPAALDSAASIL